MCPQMCAGHVVGLLYAGTHFWPIFIKWPDAGSAKKIYFNLVLFCFGYQFLF